MSYKTVHKSYYSILFLLFSQIEAQFQTSTATIIGAGYAGLDTGYRLLTMGFDVKIYEARNRVGGRVLSVYLGESEETKRVAELGGHNILDGGRAHEMRTLIEEMELETEYRALEPIHLYHLEDDHVSDPHRALKKYNFTPCSLKAKLNLILKKAHTMQEVLQELFHDDPLLYESFRIRLEDFEGASVTILSTSCIDTLYHMILGELYSDPHKENGRATRYESFLTVKGGNSLLALKLAEKLEGRIHLGDALIAVERTEEGSQYLLTFASGKQKTTDILVLTIPCTTYKDINFGEGTIPSETLQDIYSVKYGTNSKILVPVEPQLTESSKYTNGRIIALRGGHENIVTMYYVDNHGTFSAETLHNVYERDLPVVKLLATFDHSLQPPTVSTDEVFKSYFGPVGHCWPSDPYSKGSYSYTQAGQEEIFTSLEIVAGEHVKSLFAPINNTLFFAGEHTSILLDIGGTMEAAVESGERTARLIAKLCPLTTEISEESEEPRFDEASCEKNVPVPELEQEVAQENEQK